MTPGLARGPPFPSKATKNSVVAVASLDKPSVPLVVGLCEIDIGSLSQVQGAKGHAVRGLHWEGDEIWSWSQAAHLGRPAPNLISGWEDADLSLSHGVESLTVEDSDSEAENGGVALDNKARNEHIDGEDVEPFKVVESSRPEMSTKGIIDTSSSGFC
jgi:translation initiation factor 2D